MTLAVVKETEIAHLQEFQKRLRRGVSADEEHDKVASEGEG